jgi:hypothetical protein
MLRSKLLVGLAVLLGAVMLPEAALAWGPGVHLTLGNALLADLGLLASSCAQIVQAHSRAFLYGSLSADILVGKGRKLTPNHCHSWEAGFNLLRSVNEPYLKAYAYGYLSHLAADVAAHNYYVPNMLQLRRGRGRISHVHIEMQADQQMDYSQAQLKELMNYSPKEADKLLLSTVRKSKMNFSVKKKIYRSGLALARLNNGNAGLKALQDKLKAPHCGDYFEDMISLSQQLVVDCLNNLERSEVLRYDPMGFENLGLVKKQRRKRFMHPEYHELSLFFIPAMSLLNL